jgi:hypothetical protein
METDVINDKLKKQSSEEIFAEDYDTKKKPGAKDSKKDEKNENESIQSSIEFDKHQLFFHSQPNVMAYDTVTIKNTGKTCIYYQWQKNSSSFQLEEKKSDGMDRFFCHYGDDKIYPDEEREFTFSFFSEKNGVFSEEWILVTTPPLRDCDLNIHLNGLVHKYEDFYSDNINNLDKKIMKNANNTKINEFVLDLIDTIKEQSPPKPNMFNDKIFSYYFQIYNKEYNVEFSKIVMNNLNKLNNDVMNDILGIKEEELPKQEEIKEAEPEQPKQEPINTEESKDSKKKKDVKADKKKDKKDEKKEEPKEEVKEEEIKEPEKKEEKTENDEFFIPKNENEEKKFWNGSIDELKQRIELVQDEEKKIDFKNKLNCILHIAHRKGPEDSTVYDFVKKIFLDELENFNETSNKIREELSMPPYVFDLLTRESLNKTDLATYEADLKKKKDEFLKKNKKKPAGKGEEDENEVYRKKLTEALSSNILEKINDIGNQKSKNGIKENLLRANILNDNYLDRLSRVKTLNNVKTEGGFDNKYVVLRMDIEECKRNFEDDVDDDGNVVGKHLKGIDFLKTKEKMMQSLNYILNNGVRVVLLLVDFGPKLGNFSNDFSLKDLVPYIETGLDHPAFYCKNLNELIDYNKRIEEEDLKDNCCIVMENINFFPEECGNENFTDEIINPTGKEKTLSLYQKNRFLNGLMEKSTIYVNDSIFSFDKYSPTVIDANVPLKVLGAKIQEQLRKILDFFSIDNKEYILIMGDNDIFKLRNQEIAKSNGGGEEGEKNLQANILDDGTVGGTEILDYSDEETMITNLLIINSIMGRFKKIFIFGKLALQFIQFLRHDYDIFDNKLYCINENLFNLMKYILIKAYLLKIEIILPDDFKILDKEEFKKHLVPFIDSNGLSKDYTKEIKFLLKRERIQYRLEKTYTDPEELADNADYQRVKLEPEQIEHLKLYKLDTVFIDRMPYCYDFIGEFQKAQKIEKPKKIFKTTLEEYRFNENIYDKDIIYPEEVLQANEYNIEKLKKFKEKLGNLKAEPDNENKEAQAQEDAKDDKKNNKKENKNTNNNKNNENDKNQTEESKKSEEKKEEGEEKKEEEIKKEKKKYDPRLYDCEKMELVDFGEHSYQQLLDSISQMHGIMWIGRLSPSKCENVFDNYIKIINKISERKKELKEKFEEDQATEEKKLLETDLKARKQLLNVFLKGKSTYDVIKENYKLIQTGQANPDELGDEDEAGQDEEQFSHDMHALIDYYIDDDFELINSILKGKHISGFYGLDKDELIDKEEEFDPKCIEEITN